MPSVLEPMPALLDKRLSAQVSEHAVSIDYGNSIFELPPNNVAIVSNKRKLNNLINNTHSHHKAGIAVQISLEKLLTSIVLLTPSMIAHQEISLNLYSHDLSRDSADGNL